MCKNQSRRISVHSLLQRCSYDAQNYPGLIRHLLPEQENKQNTGNDCRICVLKFNVLIWEATTSQLVHRLNKPCLKSCGALLFASSMQKVFLSFSSPIFRNLLLISKSLKISALNLLIAVYAQIFSCQHHPLV